MPVTIASTAGSPVLQVLGEELRPLTPAGHGLAGHAYRNGTAGCRFLTITGPAAAGSSSSGRTPRSPGRPAWTWR
jgi:hypothetical protein